MEAEILRAFSSVQHQVEETTGGVVIGQTTFEDFYLPLISNYIDGQSTKKGPYIIGFQGCQGIGKTTLTTLIEHVLVELDFHVVRCSIDDYYSSITGRLALAEQHPGNPFYQISRGMPGTHRFRELFKMLEAAREGRRLELPKFDKSLHQGSGDVLDQVTVVEGRQDFIILEGWCVNIPSYSSDQFLESISRNEYVNDIFISLDPDRIYYQVVLEYLAEYQGIWEQFDNRTRMLGEDIRWIASWRVEQEERMKAVKGEGMSEGQIHEFVKPYIPFTWLYYDRESRIKADCELVIGEDHLPRSLNTH